MWKFGKRSEAELVGVHPKLVLVTRKALERSGIDFSVHDGIRTRATQEEYVRRGVSQTMNSKHLKQPDGYGHAVDLVPYIGGKLRWEWDPIFHIARCMQEAADELGVRLRWGGCWCELTGSAASPRLLHEEYMAQKQRQGRRAFPDGPHYELHST